MGLDFNLSRKSLSVDGNTASVDELRAFIERLELLAEHIPNIWPASVIEARSDATGTGAAEGESAVAKPDAHAQSPTIAGEAKP